MLPPHFSRPSYTPEWSGKTYSPVYIYIRGGASEASGATLIVGWLSVTKEPFRYTADKSVKFIPLIPWHVNISLRTGSTKMRKLTKLHTYFHQLK